MIKNVTVIFELSQILSRGSDTVDCVTMMS